MSWALLRNMQKGEEKKKCTQLAAPCTTLLDYRANALAQAAVKTSRHIDMYIYIYTYIYIYIRICIHIINSRYL